MKKLQLIGFVAVVCSVVATGVLAGESLAFGGPMKGRQDGGQWHRPEPGAEPDQDSGQDGGQHDRTDRARAVWFNVVCRYEKGPRHCQAAARFEKRVGSDGCELFDDSVSGSSPQFVVECEGAEIYGALSRRFTDSDGTRIQALAGPYPAVSLPPEALADGHRRIDSTLELRDGFLPGSCYLYTDRANP